METKKTSIDTMRRMKLEGITLHLFFTEKHVDYLLLLSSKAELILFSLQQQTFELLSRYHVHTGTPILFTTDGHNNPILLHSTGICIWTITQIIDKCHPEKMEAKWPSPPIRVIPLGSGEHAVVCSGGKLVLIGRERDQLEMDYDGEFMLEKAQHKNLMTTEDCLFVLVPSASNHFPYIFNRSEAKQWQKAGFLQSYVKACRKYYLDDEKLPEKESCMAFSAQRKLVYVLLRDEMRVLQWRSTQSEIGYVLSLRMRTRTKWSQVQMCCHVNDKTGAVVYAGRERVGLMQPLDYISIKRSVKQRADAMVNLVYFTSDWMLMISLHGPEKPCKLYLFPVQQTL